MKLLYEIILGYRTVVIDNVKFTINAPTIVDLIESDEVYTESYNESITEGLFDEDEYLKYLQENELWFVEEEKRLEDIPKEIEDFKVALHDNLGRSNTRKNLKEKLDKLRVEIKNLFNKKYKTNYLTAEGIATLAQSQFLLTKTVVSSSPLLLDRYCPYFDRVLSWKNNNKTTEKQIREIARSEGWRSYWDSGEPFKKPSIELTDDQRHLICISKMYDNIRESPDCPSEDVIKDDDTLDGWLIKQRRKREGQTNESELEERIGNVKGDMIFLPAETKEDAEKIEQLNSPMAKAIKNQRSKILFERGAVAEQDFPDARLKMMNILKGT